MQISEAEAMVMEVLWKKSPMGADEVLIALSVHTDWAEPTVKTLLNRLLNKGCLLYTSPSPRDQRGSRMPSSA